MAEQLRKLWLFQAMIFVWATLLGFASVPHCAQRERVAETKTNAGVFLGRTNGLLICPASSRIL